MDVHILVEPVSGSGFRAVCGEPLHLEADAPTRDEVVAKMRELIACRLENGAELVRVTVGTEEHPLAPFIGMWQDDAIIAEWRAAIDDYRESQENESDAQ